MRTWYYFNVSKTISPGVVLAAVYSIAPCQAGRFFQDMAKLK